jgi:hypothetical protein
MRLKRESIEPPGCEKPVRRQSARLLCHKIVEAHDGTISYEPRADCGSLVRFVLPANDSIGAR